MKKWIILTIAGVVVLLCALALLRGDEDTWLCDKGQWVAHGKPDAAKPVVDCYDATGFNIYFGNVSRGSADDCSLVFPLWRDAGEQDDPPMAAMRALLVGPADSELAGGYFTSINPGVSVRNLRIVNGVAHVDFDAEMERGMGGSCRVSAIRSQVTQTLLQFPGVDSVVISVEGRTDDILQP